MKRYRVFAVLLLIALLVWGGYRSYRAHANLVTLSVRNMDVHRVVSKLEWQTWERIVVNKNVSGNVTLNVRNVPLAEVLNIIGLQTASRWTALYPIYSTRESVQKLHQVVLGNLAPAESGWSNLEKGSQWSAWQMGGGSAFGNTTRAANHLVSAQILNKDLGFAALALSRFSQAQVVPEDNASGTINLKLDQAPFTKAVAKVAQQAKRKWDLIYTLQPRRGVTVAIKNGAGAGDMNIVAVKVGEAAAETIRTISPPQFDPAAQERQLEAFLATMTPEERQQAEQHFSTMQQIQSLPEGERQQRMQEIAAQAKQGSQAETEQRIQRRLRDGTTDQRVARDREKLAQRAQRQ